MKRLPIVKSSKIVYQGYFSIREDLLEQQDTKLDQSMSTLVCSDAAVVLAQDVTGKWILNEEYRHATGKILLGCPGGCLQQDEDPLVGGKREFFEETGYWSDDVAMIGCSYPMPGVSNQKIYYFLMQNAVPKGIPSLDQFEFIKTKLVDDAELRQIITNALNIDGILLTALWYKDVFFARSK